MSHAVLILSAAEEGLFMAAPLQHHCSILFPRVRANDANVTNANLTDVRGHVCWLHAAAGMHLSAQLLLHFIGCLHPTLCTTRTA